MSQAAHPLCIVGRSSSHFTRVVRMFAEECRVPYELRVVGSLLATEPGDYGGNPGLRLPNLVSHAGVTFGSLPSCRAIAAQQQHSLCMLWPEQTPPGVASNALELTLQAMATEVSAIMLGHTSSDGSAYADKLQTALRGMLVWLEQNLSQALEALPARDLSYLELCLFCLVDHLEFRELLSLAPFAALLSFRDDFGQRASALATPFEFDV